MINFRIFLGLFTLIIIPTAYATLSGSLNPEKIIERLKPEAEVIIDGEVKPKVAAFVDVGQLRYEQTCHVCHETGISGAPKFGDKTAWQKRVADGMDVVLQRALKGYKAMPAKGGCSNCSDDEIKKAIDYMIAHSQ
ncbi:MAG: putative cytochrome c5 [Francisellaceae bacterium]|nr:putative cytochrome c5 [Francisellaceae bacterium]